MTEKPAKPVRRRPRLTKPKAVAEPRAVAKPKAVAMPKAVTEHHLPTHDQISERAYFIALEQGGADELGNWLRAERELAAA
jgi:hypothetical protein